MKHWTLLTPLRLVRAVLRALVLAATAFATVTAGVVGGVLPFALARAAGVDSNVVVRLLGVAGALCGFAGAYVAGDRLNGRVRRLRATIGTASIGTDGLRWRHFGRTEFISWSAVQDVEQRVDEVVVQVRDRAAVVLRLREPKPFAEAARKALARYRHDPAPEAIAALELAGESLADWLGRARELLRGGSYRDADVGEDRCVRVATDPRAPVAQRIGSAAALSRASDEARARVRAAIAETADPAVASALEDAIEGRDDESAVRKAMGG